MVRIALVMTTVLMLALGFFLLQECAFLIPYRRLIWARYAGAIGLFGTALFVNLFAGVYLACRKFFLADTGRKLAHLEKQLRTDGSLSDELAQRLKEE